MVSISNPMPLISILLVEDEKDALELLITILTRKFPDVVLYSAMNGRMGLELFKTYTPDIVITDINMPEMSGLQMTDKIRIIKPATKLIAITGKTGNLVLQDSAEKGVKFVHYIVKPVCFQELFAAIEQCYGEIVHQTEIT